MILYGTRAAAFAETKTIMSSLNREVNDDGGLMRAQKPRERPIDYGFL